MKHDKKPDTTPKRMKWEMFKPDCHPDGNVKVCTIDWLRDMTIYAGGELTGVEPMPGALHLDLADVLPSRLVTLSGLERPNVLEPWTAYRRIAVYWPDMGTPPLPYAFWRDLVTYLKIQAPLDLVVCCQGGHGRTGTALAIIVALLGMTTTPIAWVRQHYCEEAVETQEQATYIAKITGCTEESVYGPTPKASTQAQVAGVECEICYREIDAEAKVHIGGTIVCTRCAMMAYPEGEDYR